jgi:adenosylcobinamide-GDP ribazoletransferase
MWADVRAAFSFLTILPLGYVEGRKPGWSFGWYPLVGLAIGAVLAGITALSPFAPNVTSALVLLAWIISTGGLHLDGFGDSCDGVLATVSVEKRLEIMKDPRTGTWAVVGLIVLLLTKWTTLSTVSPLLLIVPPVVGRWSMVIAPYTFPYARSSGLGAYFREGLGRSQIALATVLMLVIVGAVASTQSFAVLLAIPLALVITLGIGAWAARRLGGGLTGDVYGAICELIEVCSLLGLSVWVVS